MRRAAVERDARGGALWRRALRGGAGDAVPPPVGRGGGAGGAEGGSTCASVLERTAEDATVRAWVEERTEAEQ